MKQEAQKHIIFDISMMIIDLIVKVVIKNNH